MKKAVILTSGGLDSTTCLAIALDQGFDCTTLAFDYGQKHQVELQAASQVSKLLGAKKHVVLPLPIGQLGGSALTDPSLQVPNYQDTAEIPITYVPARNTIFLSIALGLAEVIEAYDIFIGISAVDYSHYPDCRPDYLQQFQSLVNLATKKGREGQNFTIHAPLINLDKAATIKWGLQLDIDYTTTISCYRANHQGHACGTCDSCHLRKKGFQEAGVNDPTVYS